MQNKKGYRSSQLQMISRWQESGLSQKDFCVASNISYGVFHYWYRIYRNAQTPAGSFIPLNVTPPGTTVNSDHIVLTSVSGIQVQLPFSSQAMLFLKQLLQA
jgi:hypothetical protein